MKICIVGLGYVGLPLALLCAKKGHSVIGIDNDSKIVEKLNSGKSHIHDEFIETALENVKIFASSDFSFVSECDVVIVCVPTPVDNKHSPDYSYVINATESISRYIHKEQLIIIESTISPGTTEKIVLPLLLKSGLKKEEFYLAHCPERIDPGNKQFTVDKISRVIGGVTAEATNKAARFYRSIIDAEVMELKSSKEAEAVKIMENTFRDINIAFINEMAMSFDQFGIDIMEVIKGASTKPFAFMSHYPGAGVGGHCISVDPYYLIEEAKSFDFDHQFLILARKINKGMPNYVVKKFSDGLNKLNQCLNGAKVGLLGLAYKPDVDDLRESPAHDIIKLLKKAEVDLYIYDPYILKKSNVKTLEDLMKKVDYLLLVTAHTEFKNISAKQLNAYSIKFILDGRNCLNKDEIEKLGVLYMGIGR